MYTKSMIISLHILVAVLTIISAIGAVAQPRAAYRNASYALLGATLISGVLLAAAAHASLTQLCAGGLALSVMTLAMTYASKRRQVALERA